MSNIKTILSKDGYLIKKDSCNTSFLNKVKTDLTVEPYKFNVQYSKTESNDAFQVFRETDDYLIIPKFYGIENFGPPTVNKELDGLEIKTQFKGDLRQEQKDLVNQILPDLQTKKGGVICLRCGGGKCLAKDTPVLMYNGQIKKVQDIKENEYLMGDDSLPRKVLSTTFGQEMMYKITEEDGFSYTVNESHILSLKTNINNEIYDISVKDLIKMDINKFYGFRVPVDFEDKPIQIDSFTISKYIYDGIPDEYKCNSKQKRLEILIGLINRFGIYTNNGYKLEINNDKLFNDIIFVARSLGLYVKQSYKTIYIKGLKEINFSNLKQNEFQNYLQPIDLKYKFTIKQLKVDTYYGFEINGNRRFLLGDFSVTHNTVIGLYLSCLFKVKTLIMVHKSFLLNQWKERIEQFTNAKVGIIQRNKVDIDGKDIVIGMLQSIAKEKYDPDIFRDFGMVIFDEAHHAPSKYFSKALPLINTKITLALSATPKRSDRLEKVLFWYFGPILYKYDYEQNTTVLTKIYKYSIEHEKFIEKKMRFTGDVNRPGTISNIITIGRRNRFIIDLVEDIIDEEENRKIIVLSERVEHLELLKKRLDERNITSTGLYVGGMKQSKLDESAKCQVIFGTFQMASEALDINGLNTLIMATPRREIEQTIGRITRTNKVIIRPLVIDILDNLPSFINQGYFRRTFYRKNGYQIMTYDVNENEISNEKDITITADICESKKQPEIVDFIDD